MSRRAALSALRAFQQAGRDGKLAGSSLQTSSACLSLPGSRRAMAAQPALKPVRWMFSHGPPAVASGTSV